MALPDLRLFKTPEGMPLGILYGACLEHYEILRYSQNDKERRVQNGIGNFEKRISPLSLLECQKP